MYLLQGLRFTGCKLKLAVPNQILNRICVLRFSDKPDSSIYKDDDKLVERKPLSGYAYSEEIEGFKSRWRIPFVERTSFFRTKLAVFGSKRFPGGILKLNPDNFKYFEFRKWWDKEKIEKLKHDQQFNEERLMALGCDLAAAHFVVYRGGAVKFVGNDQWIRDSKTKSDYDDDLPNQYDPNYAVEAIDLSNTKIVYEGLKNIENLMSLKWLSFANCVYFNDWCLDRVSGEHRNDLEYLDISFTRVTHRGLHALYRFHKLKTLKVDETNDDPLFFKTCLELKKEFKELNVVLVSHEAEQIESSSSVSRARI